MKNRSVVAVLLLTIVTLGFYSLYWFVSTKLEMNRRGAQIPTAWLIIIPIVNIWWIWKYSEAVAKETNEDLSTIISFLLLFLLGVIGMMIVQHEFNKGGSQPVPAGAGATAAPIAPIAPEVPTSPFPEQAAPTSVAPITPVADQSSAPTQAVPTVVSAEQPSAPVVVDVAAPNESFAQAPGVITPDSAPEQPASQGPTLPPAPAA